MQTPQWVSICAAADVSDSMRVHLVGRRRVALVRLEGDIKAFDALCPHLGGPLERGDLVGGVVTCPLHGWRFDLQAGGTETHGFPALTTFPVRQTDGTIFVQL